MLATILPFFLAAQVAVDHGPGTGSDWYHYGPECTFEVLVNMTLSNVIERDDNYCSMIASDLSCRAKGSDTLSCRFTNSRIRRPDPEDDRCSNARNFVPVRTKFINEDAFEVRFNTLGIENLVVPRAIQRWRLDMIRVIVDQLNVGFHLEKAHQRLVVTESSNMGQCEVEVKLSRTAYGKASERFNDVPRVPYEIVFEPDRPDIVGLDRASLQIQKTRHPKSCPNKKAYFFGNHEDFSMRNKTFYIDMVSSMSQLHISRDQFHSYSMVTGVMKTSDKSRIMNLTQKIDLTLKDIRAAEEPMPEIRHPAATSPFAYMDLDRMRRSLRSRGIRV